MYIVVRSGHTHPSDTWSLLKSLLRVLHNCILTQVSTWALVAWATGETLVNRVLLYWFRTLTALTNCIIFNVHLMNCCHREVLCMQTLYLCYDGFWQCAQWSVIMKQCRCSDWRCHVMPGTHRRRKHCEALQYDNSRASSSLAVHTRSAFLRAGQQAILLLCSFIITCKADLNLTNL